MADLPILATLTPHHVAQFMRQRRTFPRDSLRPEGDPNKLLGWRIMYKGRVFSDGLKTESECWFLISILDRWAFSMGNITGGGECGDPAWLDKLLAQ